jgi:Flp pilus assembly protein TadD
MTGTYVCFHNLLHVRCVPAAAAAVLFVLFLGSSAYGQRGEFPNSEVVDCMGVVEPSGSGASAVELNGEMGSSYRADVDSSGYFRFSRVPPGEYRARVLDSSGNPMETFFVSVRRAMGMMNLRLTEVRQQNRNVGGGTVSLAVLEHKIPAKAQKEMQLAMRADKKKDTGGAITHLQKAIELDPQYMQAHNDLGIKYVQTGKNDLAVAEFRKALDMDPHNPGLQANVAAALMGVHQPAEAEKAARRSVEMNGANARAHYILALAILEQGTFTPEVEKNLRQAAAEMPRAHFVLGKALVNAGQLQQGADELRAYLATGHPEERAEVEEWLKKIEAARTGCSDRGKRDCATPTLEAGRK